MREKESIEPAERNWELNPEKTTVYHHALGRAGAAPERVDDQTWSDLEMEKVFVRLDRCISPPGAQYLYALLKQYPAEPLAPAQNAKLIRELQGSPGNAAALRVALKPLNRGESAELAGFLFGSPPAVPAHYRLFYVISAVSIACTIGLVFTRAFLLPLLVLWILNGLLHRHFGRTVICHSPSLTSLTTLLGCVPKLAESIRDLDLHESRELAVCAPIAAGIQKRISRAFLRKQGNDELILVLLDYLNVFCLFELSALCRAILAVNRERPAMLRVFQTVARLDAFQGLAAAFSEYPCFCEPETKSGRGYSLVDVYHPLLDQPVSNSVEGAGNSLLLTGTNMAGKTTFIKTLALNLLFSRTLGLCLARKAALPPARVRTLIERADVTTSRQSYFYFEAIELLSMLEDARKNGREYWFVLDEIFRGTNTLERVAAGCAVLRHLNRHGLVVVSTHDHELTTLLRDDFDLYHFSEVIVDKEARFDYVLHKGPCLTRNAIKLLGLAGYPKEVTDLAGRLVEAKNEERPAAGGPA